MKSVVDPRTVGLAATGSGLAREERFWNFIGDAPIILFALDKSGVVTLSEGKGLDALGVKPRDLVGQSIFELYLEAPNLHASARRALAGEAVTFVTETNNQFFEIHLIPLFDKTGAAAGVTGVIYNITDRRRAKSLLAGEKRIFEMIAQGDPLPAILDGVCRLIEEQLPNVLASVSLLDGRLLRHGAAPSLPQAYNEAMNGLTIGPSEGSCGTAACRAEPVIVSDIAVDPLWAKYRDLALSYSLRACWSMPIVSSEDEVLGTFATYYREPRTPTSRHREMIELATHLVRVAVERDRTGQALRASEQIARSHADAMMRSLDVLVTETVPEKLIVEMLKTIGQHLDAIRVTFWLHNPKDDSLSLQMVIEDGEQVALDLDHPWVVDPYSWKTDPVVQQLVVTKAPVVCDSVERDVRITPEHRRYLTSKGCKRFMVIPLSMLGELHGFIGIQHVERATFCAEEIELAEALAHHLMIATHTQELAEQQRQAAILEERTRMARDIHDTLAQGFTGVIVQLEAVADAISSNEPKEASKYLHRASELARRSLNEARRSVHALRPEALRRTNFWDALKGIIKNTTAGSPICTKTKLRGKLPDLPPDWEKNLMHIGQEALTNTLKYAHADNFEAQLICNGKNLRLEFQDDGDGFTVEDRSDGFGLAGMRERVEQMGGKLKIASARGRGTKITVLLSTKAESV